jgi:hypothetical protein
MMRNEDVAKILGAIMLAVVAMPGSSSAAEMLDSPSIHVVKPEPAQKDLRLATVQIALRAVGKDIT